MFLVPAERGWGSSVVHSITLAAKVYLFMHFHKELLKCFTDIVSRLGTDFKEMFDVIVICKL